MINSSSNIMTEQLLRSLQEQHSAGTLRPNELDNSGLSLLHKAALNGQLLGIKCLVSYGGDLTVRSKEGFVPAHYAASGGHLPVLQYMFEKDKQSVSVQDERAISPLYIAAQEGQLDCLIWLNKYTSTKMVTKDGMSPAHTAAQQGHLDCLRYLLRVERDETLKDDKKGCSPIHYAASEGHWRVIKWMIEHCNINGEDQTCTGHTALHLAAMGGHASVIEILLKCGVSTDILDHSGKKAIDYVSDSQECFQLLQKKINMDDNSDESSEKKVRFNSMVYTYDTFPNYHHTLSENKEIRRKERSGIFWDADLQAEFDTWRNSPQMRKRRTEISLKRVTSDIYKGRSKVLGQITSETIGVMNKNKNGQSIETNTLDQPDILKNLNNNLNGSVYSSISKNSSIINPSSSIRSTEKTVPTLSSVIGQTTPIASTKSSPESTMSNPPKLPTRKKNKKERSKLKEDSIYNSLKRYHSIDIGMAFSSIYSNEYDNFSEIASAQGSSNDAEKHITDSIGNMKSGEAGDYNNNTEKHCEKDGVSNNADNNVTTHNNNKISKYEQQNAPEVPVRKNSCNLKKLSEKYLKDHPQSQKQQQNHQSALVEQLPARLGSTKELSIHYKNTGNIVSSHHNTNKINDNRTIYDARSYIPPSPGFDERFQQQRWKYLSTPDLSLNQQQPAFTNHLDLNSPRYQDDKAMQENLFQNKKVGRKNLFQSMSSFFTAIRIKKQKEKEQLTSETLPASKSYGYPTSGKKRADIFSRFSLPRSRDQKELDNLFDSSGYGFYKSNPDLLSFCDLNDDSALKKDTRKRDSISTNSIRWKSTQHQTAVFDNVGIKPKIDRSLRGTSQLVTELEQKHFNLEDYHSTDSHENLRLGRLRETKHSKKERINAFIW